MDFSDQFPLDDSLIHLNHAGVGPWPRATAEAVVRFAHQNMHTGSRSYLEWLSVEHRLRRQLCDLLNAASVDEIALLKSTSEALSTVAYGLDWHSGDNVVVGRQEFPSNRIVWESLRDRFGVEPRLVDLYSNASPEDALTDRVDSRTRLIAVSSVQYATGLRMDLPRLGDFCAARDILFCVDAIQSLGIIPFDVQTIRADFVMADGHKWLLAPEGVAVLYCATSVRDRLRLNQYGWHMVEAVGDYDRADWQPALSARRFECGSPNNCGLHALHASLELILRIGPARIEPLVRHKVDTLMEGLSALGAELLTPMGADRRAGIVTFRFPGRDNGALYQQLQERGILCAHRGGGIRFSPHFYTPEERLGDALEILSHVLGRR